MKELLKVLTDTAMHIHTPTIPIISLWDAYINSESVIYQTCHIDYGTFKDMQLEALKKVNFVLLFFLVKGNV